MNTAKQEILKEQLEECRETAKRVWKIYHNEMMRLIENPNSQLNVSALERVIENESGTFGQELARLFKDAIEFGFCHAEFISEM